MSADKNYITPKGYERLQTEYRHLRFTERPKVTEVVSWAAGNGDRSENGDYIYGKKRLREIDSRLRFLSKRLEASEVIDPEKQNGDEVRFSATVKVLLDGEIERIFCIVGEDETDATAGRISWKSPLGRSLLRKKEGVFFTFESPKGEQEIEILEVSYLAIDVPNPFTEKGSAELDSGGALKWKSE